MTLNEALDILRENDFLVESRGIVVRYHLTERKYLKNILQNGLDPFVNAAGRNTSDAKISKPGIWLAGSKDYIPVLRTLDSADKVVLKITMPYDFYISQEREYWPNGRSKDRVIAKPFDPPMNSREGRMYIEKINATIPAEYITVESDIGKNNKGDKKLIEYYRYILEEIYPDFDIDELTDKEVMNYLRRMPISIRNNKEIADGVVILNWKLGSLPEIEM